MSILEQNMRIVTALTTATALLRAGGGNPNHDPANGQFSSGGGAGHAKRAKRRARRKKRLEHLRKTTHAEIREWKDSHRWERRDLTREHRKDYRQLKKDQGKERREFNRDAKKEFAGLKKEQAKELAETPRGDHANLKVDHRGNRNDFRRTKREEWADLKDAHKDQHKEFMDQVKEDRANLKEEHAATWKRVREDFHEELASIGKSKKRGLNGGVYGGVFRAGPDRGTDGISHRMAVGKTHKASSAESILRHCLRRLGFTAAYKKGELTGAQHLELLEAVRLYGRAWLRHEAESFAGHYLAPTGRSIGDSGVAGSPEATEHDMVGSQDGLQRIDRTGASELQHDVLSSAAAQRARWVEGPDGFLILQERPGLASHFRRFFGRAKQFVRETIVAGVMSLLGPAPLTGEELDAAERAAQVQDQFFDRFHDEVKLHPPLPRVDTQVITVQPPAMTPGQFIARAEKYADSAWHAAQNANRHAAITQGIFKFEMNVMGEPKTTHCSECPELTSRGWVPIGSLPPIGTRECKQLCLCHFVFSDKPGGGRFHQGKRGPVPALPGVEMLPDGDEVHMIAEPPGGARVPIAGPPR